MLHYYFCLKYFVRLNIFVFETMDSIASITFPTAATPLAFLYFFVSTVGGKTMSSIYWVADLTEKAKRKKLIKYSRTLITS